MIIRRCNKEDIDFVYEIEKESFSDPLKKETMQRDLERESYFCYGIFDDELVAFVSFEKVFDEGQIISVATKESYRKKGYAKRLFEYALKCAREEGISFFTLEVRSNNSPAIALYKSLGFLEVGRRKNYYQNPACDALLMDLHIGED